jgi:hypothetical protein
MANLKKIFFVLVLFSLAGCGGKAGVYHDPNMDFGSIHSVAILPIASLQGGAPAAEMFRDDLENSLLATGAVYVLPSGEVGRGIMMSNMHDPASPTTDEIKKFCSMEKVNAVITGVIKEYGQVRSGGATSNVISVSLQMMEGQTGRVVWSANASLGGITILDRLFGGGASPMNNITQKAVNDLIKKLFM